MTQINIEPILDSVRLIIARAELTTGCWKRYARTEAEDRDAMPNPYGCADAINLLSTLGDMPRDEQWRSSAVHQLQNMQGEDGLFHDFTQLCISQAKAPRSGKRLTFSGCGMKLTPKPGCGGKDASAP